MMRRVCALCAAFLVLCVGITVIAADPVPGDEQISDMNSIGPDGDEIVESVPVTICADGKEINYRVNEGTVENALYEAGIELGDDDYTFPSLDTKVSPRQKIEVHRVEYIENTVKEAVPSETEYVYTSLYFRKPQKETVMQTGCDGEAYVTYSERWVDGKLENSEPIDREWITEAKNTIIKAYRPEAPVSARTGLDGTYEPPQEYQRVITGKATGYSSRGGKGASGLGLGYGTVAVDPRIIPYGSLLYICARDNPFVYGYAVATDTGTALVDGRVLVDLYYETYGESVDNGAITVDVYVVK